MTDEQRAAEQEEASLRAAERNRMGLLATFVEASQAEPQQARMARPQLIADEGVGFRANRAQLRREGMTDYEIDCLTAEMTGQPMPEPPPEPATTSKAQVAAELARMPCPKFEAFGGDECDYCSLPRSAHAAVVERAAPPVVPIEMTDDELAAAVKAVRAAKFRCEMAATALQAATAEQIAALDELDAAKARVAGGVAFLTG